jgi:hypothetical protein
MTWAQRIVLIVYCCLWVPWHSVPPDDIQVRTGYGWLSIGPPTKSKYYWETATPDLPIIGLQLLAATALASIGFVATWKQ